MWYAWLADLVVLFHFSYVAFILIGQLLILLGAVLRWQWVRNPWFRLAHLVAIGFVAIEAFLGVDCPLTVWEFELRERAGQAIQAGSFIGRWAHRLLFYEIPPEVLDAAHIVFAVLVLATFVFLPPRWPRRL